MNRTGVLAALTLVIAGAMPAVAASKKALDSPQAGVLCDQYMCADADGLSKTLTEKFLGTAAATKLFSQGDFDTTEFTFANGVFCDAKEQTCHKDRYFDANGKRSATDVRTTAILFGK